MNKRKKRVRRYYKNFKKTNFVLLNKILRILSWFLPGLVIKRWMLTSAIGFLTTLLGFVIWTNLRPLYWLIERFFVSTACFDFFKTYIKKHLFISFCLFLEIKKGCMNLIYNDFI